MKNKERKCEACGADCRRKKVGAGYFKKVICLSCHFSNYAGFDADGNLIIRPENDWRKPEPTAADKLLEAAQDLMEWFDRGSSVAPTWEEVRKLRSAIELVKVSQHG